MKQPPATQSPPREGVITIAECPNSSSTSPSTDIEVKTCRLTRKGKGVSIVCNCWVKIDRLRVLCKVVNTSKGLIVCLPASSYRSGTGRTCYAKRVECVDPDLKDEIQDAVLTAYRQMLDETGRREPLPYERPEKPDRLGLALSEASELQDSAKGGEVVYRCINEILEDPESEGWEKSKACTLALKLLAMDQDRTFAAFRVMGELARAEAVARASAP